MLQRRDRVVLLLSCLALPVLGSGRAEAQMEADTSAAVGAPSETPAQTHPGSGPRVENGSSGVEGLPPATARSTERRHGAPYPAAASYPFVVAPLLPPAPPRAPLGITAAFGIRSDLVRSTGIDPFSTSDDVHQTALSIGYRFGESDRAGIGAAFEWNHGSTNARARGADATLTIDRLSLGLEGRVPLTNRLSAFARLAPGLLRQNARLDDASGPPPAYGTGAAGRVQQTAWIPTGDLSGGLAYLVGSLRAAGAPAFGFWLAAEGGYGYSASRDLVLSPGVETQPGRTDESVRLGSLAYRGAFLRFQLAVAF